MLLLSLTLGIASLATQGWKTALVGWVALYCFLVLCLALDSRRSLIFSKALLVMVMCPCSRVRSYADCCKPLHDDAAAPDAEALMRSRYSAYVRRDADYLRASWHASTRPDALGFDDPQPVWLGLDVKAHDVIDAERAEVDFVAKYRIGGGSVVRMRERSRFVREDGRWFYVDGEVG